ncbi:hypothetical protein TNCV_1609801 [Trichonephila clavipes]|nr:hypothetical protein TNCV_1609801 [Trichonephila clavipes]
MLSASTDVGGIVLKPHSFTMLAIAASLGSNDRQVRSPSRSQRRHLSTKPHGAIVSRPPSTQSVINCALGAACSPNLSLKLNVPGILKDQVTTTFQPLCSMKNGTDFKLYPISPNLSSKSQFESTPIRVRTISSASERILPSHSSVNQRILTTDSVILNPGRVCVLAPPVAFTPLQQEDV